ncbi:MAG: hypothetical protein CMM52_01345 [Rhodospirillaceae bacterium]|nr:hypothetical protein [Rhodospirillaceae bacterium]|tara:strand:- start:1226 stop:1987 length:762 start_codon:yes stop_codon:yes gene_type:complete
MVSAEISYDNAPVPVRDDITSAHRRAWSHIASPGTWLDGKTRVAIAAETRNAAACTICNQRKQALSPYAIEGMHDGLGELPENFIEVIHRIATDPARLTETWVKSMLDGGIPDTEYVELVSVLAHTMCVDTFCDGIGIERHALPEPQPGTPTKKRPEGASVDVAWLPTVPPEMATGDLQKIYPSGIGDAPNAPNVRRAMSLVPQEAISFFALNDVQYLPPEAMWQVEVNPRSIEKAQIELVAGRVSSLNGCYY